MPVRWKLHRALVRQTRFGACEVSNQEGNWRRRDKPFKLHSSSPSRKKECLVGLRTSARPGVPSQSPVWVCLLPFSSERFVSPEAGASICPISQRRTIIRSAPTYGGQQCGDGGKQSELPLRLSRSHNRLGDETLKNRTEFVKRNTKTAT
ncbi:unnamed protein product [Ixodes pacificus]